MTALDMTAPGAATLDVEAIGVRAVNQRLHAPVADTGHSSWRLSNPMGAHAIAAGLTQAMDVHIDGHVGYYCAGMNQQAAVTIDGHCGWGVAENMMSGVVRVTGNASQAAAASGHGGLVIIEGDAGHRCGISMKGIDIVVGGSIGHSSSPFCETTFSKCAATTRPRYNRQSASGERCPSSLQSNQVVALCKIGIPVTAL